jgi:hypothetical protein
MDQGVMPLNCPTHSHDDRLVRFPPSVFPDSWIVHVRFSCVKWCSLSGITHRSMGLPPSRSSPRSMVGEVNWAPCVGKVDSGRGV